MILESLKIATKTNFNISFAVEFKNVKNYKSFKTY